MKDQASGAHPVRAITAPRTAPLPGWSPRQLWSLRSWPALTPLWCVADGGTLYLTTGFAIRAATNIARTPEVALMLVGSTFAPAGEQCPCGIVSGHDDGVRTRGVVSSVVAVNPASHALATRARAEAVKH